MTTTIRNRMLRYIVLGTLIATNFFIWSYMLMVNSNQHWCASSVEELYISNGTPGATLTIDGAKHNEHAHPPRPEDEDDVFKIPSDKELNAMSNDDLLYTFKRYTQSFQSLCRNQQRIGSLGDGGKEICVDRAVRPRKDCIVYSFGSANDFTFEEGIIEQFQCKVYTFDPSMINMTKENISTPTGCTFFPIGLGSRNYVTKNNWRMLTFDTILSQLNHSHELIDVLKVDIEKGEWDTFNQMLHSGSFKNVRQLQVELHFYDYDIPIDVYVDGKSEEEIQNEYLKQLEPLQEVIRRHRLGMLRRLYEYGLKIFSSERNVFYNDSIIYIPTYKVNVAPLVELSFLNSNIINTATHQ